MKDNMIVKTTNKINVVYFSIKILKREFMGRVKVLGFFLLLFSITYFKILTSILR